MMIIEGKKTNIEINILRLYESKYPTKTILNKFWGSYINDWNITHCVGVIIGIGVPSQWYKVRYGCFSLIFV